MERQHIVLHRNWTALQNQLLAVVEGSRSGLDDAVLTDFTGGYDRHIAIEEPLFVLGREVIPEEQRRAIGKIMAARRRG